MDKIITIHKLCVDFKGDKFVQMACGNVTLGKLLKEMQKNYLECFPGKGKPRFERIVDEGFVVPLSYLVGEVFGVRTEVQVFEKEMSSEKQFEKNDLKESRKEMHWKEEVKRDEARREESRREDVRREETYRKEEGHRKEEVIRKEEAHRREEIKREELKREEEKEKEKEKEKKDEEGLKESKIEVPKKKQRHERGKEIVNKFLKVDEKRVPVQNEPSKRDPLLSSSSTDSDADIFIKDEKKPSLSKSNIFKS